MRNELSSESKALDSIRIGIMAAKTLTLNSSFFSISRSCKEFCYIRNANMGVKQIQLNFNKLNHHYTSS